MTSRWARVAQGAAVAAFATFVAALSHTVGGGAPPGLLAVVLSMAFSTLLCLTVAGGRLTLTRTVIAVAATQFLLHTLYSVQGAAPIATSGSVSHQHAAVDWSSTAGSPLSYEAPMLVSHLVAIAVTVVAIRHGKRAMQAALRAIRVAVASVLPSVPVLDGAWLPRPRPVAMRSPRPSIRLVVLSAMRHRGPPVGFAAA
ncbi:hypothetical protein LQ757_04415 [Agromyces sp. SYSU K20354]|uniref:hypothetical protein n=1 Tax=Agromyces cavernae TaxID=2898659 RepID=UPI001E4D3172|nr:hypothetical protein [Agromyces cavernae]MCD2441517.1 hypothetical protein [Agromyces cavernae]